MYYVYLYIREDGTPYYIGKGSYKRAWVKSRTTPIPKDKSKIVILKEFECEYDAYDYEIRLIRWYGRIDNGSGILRNLTDGGEGNRGRSVSDNTREKLRLANLGENNPRWGKTLSEDHKRKISEANKGRSVSEENKKKLSKLKTGVSRSEETKRKISEARRKTSHTPNTRKCSIRGILYDSLADASRALGVHVATIRRRINSDKFPEYMYLP